MNPWSTHRYLDQVGAIIGRKAVHTAAAIRRRLGRTLHSAAAANDVKGLERLLGRNRGSAVNYRDQEGRTALHIAVEHHNTDCVSLLLAAGADPLAVTENGDNALVIAVRGGCLDAVEVLLGARALDDYTRPADEGDVSRPLACEAVSYALADTPDGAGADATRMERRRVASRLAQLLLDAGASPEECMEGVPLLVMASQAGLAPIVQLLLRLGVAVDAAAASNARSAVPAGASAIHTADHPDIVRMLVQAGADVNARDADAGRTPLHYCSAAPVARALVIAGADSTMVDDRGYTWGHRPWIDQPTQRLLREATTLAAGSWRPASLRSPLSSPVCRLGCFAVLLFVQRRSMLATGQPLTWDEQQLLLRQFTVSLLLRVGKAYALALQPRRTTSATPPARLASMADG